MGRRKRNETEADDEEGKRLMERIHSTTCTLLINAQHGLCTVLTLMVAFHLRSCRVTCRLQNNIRRLLPFVDVR